MVYMILLGARAIGTFFAGKRILSYKFVTVWETNFHNPCDIVPLMIFMFSFSPFLP